MLWVTCYVMYLALLKKKSSLLLKLVMYYQSLFLTEIFLIQGGGEKTAVRLKMSFMKLRCNCLPSFISLPPSRQCLRNGLTKAWGNEASRYPRKL